MRRSARNIKGFTLLELMIVVTIIGILATLAVPQFRVAVLKSKEAALKEDLFNIRSVLDQYYADNGKYPDALANLVDKGYMRGIPVDPFTASADTWRLAYYTSDSSGGGDEGAGGIFDVHSGSDAIGLNGKPYSEW